MAYKLILSTFLSSSVLGVQIEGWPLHKYAAFRTWDNLNLALVGDEPNEINVREDGSVWLD